MRAKKKLESELSDSGINSRQLPFSAVRQAVRPVITLRKPVNHKSEKASPCNSVLGS